MQVDTFRSQLRLRGVTVVEDEAHLAEVPSWDAKAEAAYWAAWSRLQAGETDRAPEPLDLQQLANRGSLYITRPTLLTYSASTEELRQSSEDLFARIFAGDIRVEINQRYPLVDVPPFVSVR